MALTSIIKGMTPAEYITAMNSNYSQVKAGDIITITSGMNGGQLVSAINSNSNSSITSVGQKSGSFTSSINGYFSNYDLSLTKPSSVSILWENDYAKIEFSDNSSGIATHEIWESKDGGAYQLSNIIPSSQESLNYYSYQNATYNFRIRAKNGNAYSEFTDIVNLVTPLVFKVDQSELWSIHFLDIRQLANSTVIINWGDGNHTDLAAGASVLETHDLYHDYASTGIYFITISGDINDIYWFDFSVYNTSVAQPDAFGDLTKWQLPQGLGCFHLYRHSFTGDISNWAMPTSSTVPSKLGIMHIQENLFTGDVTNWEIESTQAEVRLAKNYNLEGDITNWVLPLNNGEPYFYLAVSDTKISGNLTDWVLPVNLRFFQTFNSYCGGNVTDWAIPVESSNMILRIANDATNYYGDLTDWELPQTPSTMGYNFGLAGGGHTKFTGDLSGWSIPAGVANITFNLEDNSFTKMPRGAFRWVNIFNFSGNNCDTTEIDSLLAHIDAYFVGGVVPLTNAVYTLNGVGMGIPSAAGLVSRSSILSKYTSAGKTCSILVNS